MTKSADFFQNVKPAAVLKHAVLEGYSRIFATMTGSVGSHTVWIIDAYAGPGDYASDGDGPAAPGSPRIVCDLAESLAATGPRLRGAFVERKPSYANQLRAVIGESGEHVVFQGDASEHLLTALKAAGTDPVLLFLDPFGVSLPLDLLTEAVNGRPKGAKTEVLLNFNIEAVSRIGGILESRKPQTHDAKTLDRADRFLGGTWWRDEFIKARRSSDDATATRAAWAIATQYQSAVHDRTGLGAVHVPIRRRAGAQPLFFLTLFTSYEKAPYIFVEVASSANQKWRDFNRQKALEQDVERYSTTLFTSDLLESVSAADQRDTEAALDNEWSESIKRSILQLLRTRQSLNVATDIVEIYGSTVTLAREKHLRKAWDELASDGRVSARDKSRKLRDQVIRQMPSASSPASHSR